MNFTGNKSIGLNNMVLVIVGGCMMLSANRASAQFSPGELSKAHHKLEGSNNCTQCHDVGKEMSGSKCLVCHEEIQFQRDQKRGFHFAIAAEKCVACHKEHAGLDAKITLFDEKKFDHERTGFLLTGKHDAIACAQCHTAKHIHDPLVQKKLAGLQHQTFLGLNTACVSCHEDPHRKQFSQECSTCHATSTWSKVHDFDHSRAKFPLEGKHLQIDCSKCHASLTKAESKKNIDFTTKDFSDCTPCHATPHGSKFEKKECKSCHTVQGWSAAIDKPFNHAWTAYPLVGRHASVRCEQCHRATANVNFTKKFQLPFKQCTDCHTDKHHGEFSKTYNNNCASCHTEYGFKPSTFTLARHNVGRFKLAGAHLATPCAGCHVPYGETTSVFHFTNTRCESCHKDVHNGQFSSMMKESSCGTCHTTDDWKRTSFDHSTTRFSLSGRHASIACSDCHSETKGSKALHFNKLPIDCQSCHKDIHQEQFAVGHETKCNSCHTSVTWKTLNFDHETRSVFHLTGAHKNVQCRACHKEEQSRNGALIRFKPLSIACESCHQQKGKR